MYPHLDDMTATWDWLRMSAGGRGRKSSLPEYSAPPTSSLPLEEWISLPRDLKQKTQYCDCFTPSAVWDSGVNCTPHPYTKASQRDAFGTLLSSCICLSVPWAFFGGKATGAWSWPPPFSAEVKRGAYLHDLIRLHGVVLNKHQRQFIFYCRH
jgi:hypothetical protein